MCNFKMIFFPCIFLALQKYCSIYTNKAQIKVKQFLIQKDQAIDTDELSNNNHDLSDM